MHYVRLEELTSYDRTTALHSINLTDTLIKIKDKEFMKYYDRFKDANEEVLAFVP